MVYSSNKRLEFYHQHVLVNTNDNDSYLEYKINFYLGVLAWRVITDTADKHPAPVSAGCSKHH